MSKFFAQGLILIFFKIIYDVLTLFILNVFLKQFSLNWPIQSISCNVRDNVCPLLGTPLLSGLDTSGVRVCC